MPWLDAHVPSGRLTSVPFPELPSASAAGYRVPWVSSARSPSWQSRSHKHGPSGAKEHVASVGASLVPAAQFVEFHGTLQLPCKDLPSETDLAGSCTWLNLPKIPFTFPAFMLKPGCPVSGCWHVVTTTPSGRFSISQRCSGIPRPCRFSRWWRGVSKTSHHSSVRREERWCKTFFMLFLWSLKHADFFQGSLCQLFSTNHLYRPLTGAPVRQSGCLCRRQWWWAASSLAAKIGVNIILLSSQ